MKREIRRKGPRRLFDQSEDTEMERLRIAGYSLALIAETLHRTKSSVQIRLNLLAERDENNA